jgi:hypothetical protein
VIRPAMNPPAPIRTSAAMVVMAVGFMVR